VSRKNTIETDARELMAQRVLAAREDPNAYIELVARADGGQPVVQGPIHREWQNLMSAHDKLIIFASVGLGKSSQLRWRLEWELGRNPNLRIGLVSSAQASMPGKMLSAIRSTIDNSKALRYVFPHLRPSTVQKKWGDAAITVERADNSPDPSIQIFGTTGKILGSRLDLIIVDDICNQDNTRTELLRDKIHNFMTGPMMSRFSGKGGRLWIIGNID
jgi:hypothetical protein